MRLITRLIKAERKAAQRAEKPQKILILKHEAGVYSLDGVSLTDEEYHELETTRQLIIVEYTNKWPPGDEK